MERAPHSAENDAPRLLDLFCGEGGAAVGYARAGFVVHGVDLDRARGRRYPFTFHAADAIEYAKEHAHEYDAIHASPPCQRYTHGNVAGQQAARHPDLIGPTRDVLAASGLPYVIENVPRSPLIDPLVLCGTMFDLATVDDDGTPLQLRRHRHFESNVRLTAPRPCVHPRGVQWAGSYGGARRDKSEARHVRHGGYVPSVERQRQLMGGIDWTTVKGMQEAIPPVYTEWIGQQLIRVIPPDKT
jgi:DNA (cytosine-5)-methyltransferase 1